MSTISFERPFVVEDKEASLRFLKDIESPITVKVAKRNLNQDSKKGMQLLKQRFSHSGKS
jgi:hypothetical protein